MANEAIAARSVAPVIDTPARRSWRKFRTHRSAILGALIVGAFLMVALLAPVLPIADPAATDWAAVRQAPGAAHPLDCPPGRSLS